MELLNDKTINIALILLIELHEGLKIKVKISIEQGHTRSTIPTEAVPFMAIYHIYISVKMLYISHFLLQ